MPTKLSTTVNKIDLIPNRKNAELIHKNAWIQIDSGCDTVL
jgi:hypothetical protein